MKRQLFKFLTNVKIDRGVYFKGDQAYLDVDNVFVQNLIKSKYVIPIEFIIKKQSKPKNNKYKFISKKRDTVII